ncbi:hypothetical protein RHSIM_RhsimMtG0002600 (mitochondrion) [Rhododendron simsii]|uniref:Ribosomal protein S3 n=1 Tax=Rhododendron simsii TaxID=118357 RepID=A0A834FY97_RHOSS|nr:hypothetical protein RHSIM_RhsimMtG0002600 [Rhododendron simsii]
MGQKIKRFDFVPRDPPQVGFESRVMGDYPARCIILHFPKRTFIHFFLPRRPRRLKRREKSRPGKKKGRRWAFGEVGPIGCLHSSDGTEEERNEVRGRGAGERVESIRLDDREKQNEIRIWPKKKQRYGYHDRSPSRKKNLSKSLRVSGAFKHPKYAEVVNDIAFLIENDESFRKTKLFKFFFPKKSRSDGPTSHLLKRTLPAVRPSLNYLIMQYLLNTKNQMHFDPVVVLNHFVAPGVTEPSTMGGANAQEISFDKRIRSRIAFFVESLTSEKKCLAEAKKRLTHFICQANDLRFAGTTKTTISLFPFFGATFFFPRDGVGVYNNLFFEDAREKLLGKLRRKCWNLLGKDKVMELIEKFIDLGGIGELIKGIEMMIDIILRNRRIPYGCSRGCKPDGTQLGFGRYGIQSCRAGRLSYRAIEAARRAIIGQFHRAMSGQFRRNGKIWVRVFADLPITGKPTEVRMGRGKGNPILVRLDLNRSSDSSRFHYLFTLIKTLVTSMVKELILSLILLLLTIGLWDSGLTWVAPLVAVFGDWLDLLLSYMDGWTLSMRGGGSEAGPSRRPVLDLNSSPEPELDLNQPPAQELEEQPEPVPQQPNRSRRREAPQDEIRINVKRLRFWNGKLKAWEHQMEIALRKERESNEKKELHRLAMEQIKEFFRRRGQ